MLKREIVVLNNNTDKDMLDIGDNNNSVITNKTKLVTIVLLDSKDKGPVKLDNTILMLAIMILCVARLIPLKLLL
jgi:hypothetical protein